MGMLPDSPRIREILELLKVETGGAAVEIVYIIDLKYPCRYTGVRQSYFMVKCQNTLRNGFIYTSWDTEYNCFGPVFSEPRQALAYLKEHANAADRRDRDYLITKKYESGFADLYAMTSSEIVALGLTHRKHKKAWGALRNPLVLPKEMSRTLRINEKTGAIGNRELLAWIAERPWAPVVKQMTAKVSSFEKTYLRFEVIVLDFDEPAQAMEFKFRWL